MWHQQINSPLQSMARWDNAVFSEPLANLLDQHEQYCVALVDRAHLRIFSVFLGEIEECLRREFGSRRTRHIKTSGTDHIGSASQIQRKADEQVRANLRRSVMLIDSFVHLRKTDRLLLAGTPEITAQLRESLPKRVASRVIGSLNLAFESTPQEVLAASEPIATKDERDLENQCVDKVVTTAAKTEQAVVGLDSTLDAINFDRVWQLVYSEGASQKGFECANCQALFAVTKDECPYCNGAVKAVADVAERMLERALRKGANVEVVTGSAKQNLDRVGGVGALLRTRTKPAAKELL
jgi:peptide subunit release factor 1 (eRF1)